MKTPSLRVPPARFNNRIRPDRGHSGGHGTFRRFRAAGSVMPGMFRVLLAGLVLVGASARAIVYDFLPVTIVGTNSGQFTSQNANGFITATTEGVTNISGNNTVYLSTFTNLFLPSGTVQGYATRYDNYSVYTNTFYLTNYALTTNLVFGIWNITEETNAYQLKLFNGNTQLAPPFNWNFIGYDDNAGPTDVNIAHTHMNLIYASGFFSPTNYKTLGVDCDGAFWNKIPTNTTKIVLTGLLNSNNMDGVVFYFAEPRPPCTIICPSNIIVTICGPSGTNVTYPTPTVFGDCGTNTTISCDPSSGSFFPLGTNVVTCTVPGQSNLSCSFTVAVVKSDPIPPVINCPSNIVIFTCGTSAVATYTVTATDNSGTVVSTNCSPASGSTFPLGTNTVSCTAFDACSNFTTCAFDVIVKPYPLTWGVVCPNESLSVNVTGCPPVMPNLTNLITITNQCAIPGGLSITQAPPAGTVLSSGSHQVTITVCATNGLCQTCNLNVNASLSAGCCSIACPTNITVTTCGTNAVATFPTPVVSGPCASTVTVVCAPPSGSVFPLGTNTVTCTATNGAGVVIVSCSFKVIVAASAFADAFDFLPVSITGPGGKFTSLNGNGFITVTNTGGPFLPLNNTVYSSQFPNLFAASGTVQGWLARADNNATYINTFYLANYTLSPATVFGMWNITEEPNTYSIKLLDASGNQISPPFNWNFMGYDDDSLSGNIAWYHMNLNYTTGFFSPTNYKASGIDCDAAFWTNIPANTRKIVVTGTLGANNADGVVFYFAERAACAHIACPPNMTVGTCGTNAIVNYPAPVVTGASASSMTVTCTPPSGSKFPLGTTTVTCTAKGPTGLIIESCSFTVTVVPSIIPCTSPVLTIKPVGTNVVVSWPDTHNGFELQEAPGLEPPISWLTIDAPVTMTNETFQVILPHSNPRRFYRLRN